MSTSATSLVLSAATRDWLLENLERGAAAESLQMAMVAQGLDAEFSRQAIAAAQAQLADGGFDRTSPWRLPTGSILDGGDRQTPVLMRLAVPRVALLGEVLSAEECAALIALAAPRLTPSTVIDPGTGADVVARYRSSEGVFFRPAETPLVARLDARLAALAAQPTTHGEGLQVLRYGVGGESAPHVDWLPADSERARASIARSGQRMATLLVYLNDVAGGGETWFPQAGLRVTPRRGQALYFEYCDAAGRCDPRSVHGGAAVTAGEKWIVTKWLRQRPFVPQPIDRMDKTA